MHSVVMPYAILAGLLMISGVSNALLVNGNTKILAYFLTSCPSGWTTTASDPYGGRVVKGTLVNPGTTMYDAQTSTNPIPNHSHNSGWNVRTRISVEAETGDNIFCDGSPVAAQVNVNYDISSATAGVQMSQNADATLPGVLMNLCAYTSSEEITLPVGIVTYMDRTVASCSDPGFEPFADAEGRFLVFGGSTVDLSSPKVSPATRATASGADIGVHAHSIPTFSYSARKICRTSGFLCAGSGNTAAKGGTSSSVATYTFTGTAPTSSSAIPVSYVQLIACRVKDATTNSKLPHPDAVFFYDGHVCPPLYRDAAARSDGFTYSNIVGRLIWNRNAVGTPGQPFGGAQFTYALGTNVGLTDIGHSTHTHRIQVSNFNFPNPYKNCRKWSACSGSLCNMDHFMSYTGYSFDFPTGPESATTGLIPYRVMRACSPQAPTSAPTFAPTASPTTSRPTNSPTTSYPTQSPTIKPTHSPTLQPTDVPTKSPTSTPTIPQPTKSPSTPTTLTPTTFAPTPPPSPSASPSASPTSSKPSMAPSRSPVTSAPTKSPTKAPVFLNLCQASDATLFGLYDSWYGQQASWCAAECRVTLLGGGVVDMCVNTCEAFAQYTAPCVSCFQRYLECQNDYCQHCLVATTTYQSNTCQKCSTESCRFDLARCTGFNADLMQTPTQSPNTQTQDGESSGSINLAPIIGGVVGGFAALLAGVFIVQRRRRDKRVENGLKQAWADRLFAKSTEDQLESAGGLSALSPASAMFEMSMPSNAAFVDSTQDMRVPLRTRFSFHGDAATDELDVPAGVALTGVSRNRQWWVAIDESTQTVGLIPAAYCSET